MTCRHDCGSCTHTEEVLLRGPIVTAERCSSCANYEGPARGLGDILASVTHAVGIAPCGGCQKRRERLNEIALNPFKTR